MRRILPNIYKGVVSRHRRTVFKLV